MARRGSTKQLREQAVELLGTARAVAPGSGSAQRDGADTGPPEITAVLGITEEQFRELRKTRLFGEAVLSRAHQMLDESMPFVLRRIIDQAEAGQATQQKILIDYRIKLKELEAANSSERWSVGWSSAPAPKASPPDSKPDGDE